MADVPAASPALILELPSLDNTYGALFLGTAFGLMLYGLTVHQTYRYFRLYGSADIGLLIGLVIVIWILETLHTVVITVACYYHLVSNYFNPAALLVGHWSTRVLTPTTGVIILVCQSFYARRVWMVGPNYRYLVSVSGVLMLGGFGFVIAATVEGVKLSLSDFKHVSWLVSSLFGLAVLVDLVMTATLITILVANKTGLRRTDSTIEVLIMYSINTGLMTTIFGLLCFVFAIILPGNLIYIGISIVGTKIYANSVLAVLNSRRSLSNRLLEGFEAGSDAARGPDPRPHTAVETWDVPQLPGGGAQSHMSFARPTDLSELASDSDVSSTAKSPSEKKSLSDLKEQKERAVVSLSLGGEGV